MAVDLEFIGAELPERIPAWCRDLADALVQGAESHPGQWARFPRIGVPGSKKQSADVGLFTEHFRPADGYLTQNRAGEWFVRFSAPAITKGRTR